MFFLYCRYKRNKNPNQQQGKHTNMSTTSQKPLFVVLPQRPMSGVSEKERLEIGYIIFNIDRCTKFQSNLILQRNELVKIMSASPSPSYKDYHDYLTCQVHFNNTHLRNYISLLNMHGFAVSMQMPLDNFPSHDPTPMTSILESTSPQISPNRSTVIDSKARYQSPLTVITGDYTTTPVSSPNSIDPTRRSNSLLKISSNSTGDNMEPHELSDHLDRFIDEYCAEELIDSLITVTDYNENEVHDDNKEQEAAEIARNIVPAYSPLISRTDSIPEKHIHAGSTEIGHLPAMERTQFPSDKATISRDESIYEMPKNSPDIACTSSKFMSNKRSLSDPKLSKSTDVNINGNLKYTRRFSYDNNTKRENHASITTIENGVYLKTNQQRKEMKIPLWSMARAKKATTTQTVLTKEKQPPTMKCDTSVVETESEQPLVTSMTVIDHTTVSKEALLQGSTKCDNSIIETETKKHLGKKAVDVQHANPIIKSDSDHAKIKTPVRYMARRTPSNCVKLEDDLRLSLKIQKKHEKPYNTKRGFHCPAEQSAHVQPHEIPQKKAKPNHHVQSIRPHTDEGVIRERKIWSLKVGTDKHCKTKKKVLKDKRASSEQNLTKTKKKLLFCEPLNMNKTKENPTKPTDNIDEIRKDENNLRNTEKVTVKNSTKNKLSDGQKIAMANLILKKRVKSQRAK